MALSADGRQRAGAAAEVAAYATARREVYGRTTGVGANRETAVSSGDTARHGLRLVRSHAGGGGPLTAAELSRGMLVVRVNQIAAAENPLIDVAGQAVWHNGNFHTAYVGLALDGDVVTARRLLPELAALVPPAHPAIAGGPRS